MSEQKTVKLTDLLTSEQLDEVERILNNCGGDCEKATKELRVFLVQHREELESKGCVPEYLAYVIAYKQWTGGDNGDRSVAFST